MPFSLIWAMKLRIVYYGLIVLKIVDILAKRVAKAGNRYGSYGWFELTILQFFRNVSVYSLFARASADTF